MVIKKLRKLQTEYRTDPEGRGYAGMTAEQILADLTEKRYTKTVEAWITDRWLDAKVGLTRAAEIMTTLQAANTPLTDRAYELLRDRASGGLNVGEKTTLDAIDALAQAGIIDAAEAAMVKAEGQKKESRADQVGYPNLVLINVQRVKEAG